MSLTVLILLVVIGVSVVVGAVHLAGGSKQKLLADADAARKRFLIDFPEFDITGVLVSADHKKALLINETGTHAGLVVVMGAHSLTRMVDQTLLKSVFRSKTEIVLALTDLTLPVVQIAYEQARQVDKYVQALETIANGGAKN